MITYSVARKLRGTANNFDPGFYIESEVIREKSFGGGNHTRIGTRKIRNGEEYIIEAEQAMMACSVSRKTGCNGCPVYRECVKLYEQAAGIIGSRTENPAALKRIGKRLVELTKTVRC